MPRFIRLLIAGLRQALADERELTTVIDSAGNPLRIEREFLEAAIRSELLDLGAGQRLVWHENYTITMGLRELRSIVHIAQHYDDEDIALIAIAAEATFAEDD